MVAVRKLGDIYKRKDSPYFWIWFYGANKKRKHESTYTKSKSMARDILNRRITEAQQIREGIKQDSDIPFSVFIDKYLNHIRARERYHTIRSYKSVIGIFNRWLSEKDITRLKNVDKPAIEKFITYRREAGKSGKTCNNNLVVLKAMFYWAISEKYINENPVKGVSQLTTDDSKAPMALSPEEYQRFINVCKKHHKYYYSMFYTLIHTGLRLGELINLKWTDIENNILWVELPKRGRKDQKIRQKIPLHGTVINVFKSIPHKSDYVFVDKAGKSYHGFKTPQRYRDKTIKRVFKDILKRANITKVDRTHELRHTFCSLLTNLGIHPAEIREFMRHEKQSTTQIYTHLFDTTVSKSINKLQKLDK